MAFKFWKYIAEECTILLLWFGGMALFNYSVIMHSFYLKYSDFGEFQHMHYKIFIGFALSV